MVDQIWVMLYELIRKKRTERQWAEFRATVELGACGYFSHLYQLKTGNRHLFGPHGLVVRETVIDSPTGSHDYLRCPEIVQDIAICYQNTYAINLEQRFRDASKPCIVKFRSTQIRPGTIIAALWYVFSKLRDGKLTDASNWSFDGEGVPVPAKDVVNVEVIATK